MSDIFTLNMIYMQFQKGCIGFLRIVLDKIILAVLEKDIHWILRTVKIQPPTSLNNIQK